MVGFTRLAYSASLREVKRRSNLNKTPVSTRDCFAEARNDIKHEGRIMDKIAKVLKLLTIRERQLVRQILDKLRSGRIINLDLKKLKGHVDIYRIRQEKIRIIYRLTSDRRIFILAIERRRESTYRNL